MGVSKNNGTPKSSILIGCSIINHPFWWFSPYFWKHPYIPPQTLSHNKSTHNSQTFRESQFKTRQISRRRQDLNNSTVSQRKSDSPCRIRRMAVWRKGPFFGGGGMEGAVHRKKGALRWTQITRCCTQITNFFGSVTNDHPMLLWLYMLYPIHSHPAIVIHLYLLVVCFQP